MKNRPNRKKLLLLLTAATVVALLLAEVGARVGLARLNAMPPKKPTGAGILLVELLQRAAHPDVVFELQRHLDCTFQGVRVVTNSHGHRGPERPIEKPENGFRILGLGDSVLFGWGVPGDECGLAGLERRLAARLPDRAVDTINTGVPGYNTAMQAQVFATTGLAFTPDVVILDYVGNDLELPNFLLAPDDFWRVDHCYLYDLALRAYRSTWLDPRTPFLYAPGDGNGRFESDPDLVPTEYRHLVGIEAYRRSVQRIAELARERGIPVLVTSCGRFPEPIAAAIAAAGLPSVTLAERLTRYCEEHDVTNYFESELTVGPEDPHPSAIVHEWWSEAVLEKLDELGWLP